MMRFTRSIWFNTLLRETYNSLPFPEHIKHRLKEIYLGRAGTWKISNKDVFKLDGGLEALPRVAASARQFDPDDPWVLVIDLRIPTPDQDSGSVRISAILHLLRETGFRITFISDSEEPLPCDQENLELRGIEVLSGFDAARHHLAAAGGKYHFSLLSRPEVALRYLPYVRAYALYSYVIYDTVDLHWIRFEREMRISDDPALLGRIASFRRTELFNTACADLTLAISDEEKNCLITEQPDANVAVLPNIHEIFPPKTPFALRKGLLFIGGFWHKPNEDAAIHFANNILPQITEKIPNVVFYIIGSNMPASVKSLRSHNVEPLGFVADVAPYFESCRVFVAPLRFGAGMKGKVGQSMSHGLPVVTTQIGAEGMDLQHEQELLIADNPLDFADGVIRLYHDEILWHRLSARALAHVDANYSHAATQKRMARIFSGRQGKPNPPRCYEFHDTAIPTSSGEVSASSKVTGQRTG
ncbi:MAG: glycosyltransferase [Nitrosospira sp.]|nr:glycosyltransferase [Nitrosospira sp.]